MNLAKPRRAAAVQQLWQLIRCEQMFWLLLDLLKGLALNRLKGENASPANAYGARSRSKLSLNIFQLPPGSGLEEAACLTWKL